MLIPNDRPADADLKKLTKSALASGKGAGWAARLFESCDVNELPVSITAFLSKVYAAFPKPAEPSAETLAAELELPAAQGAGATSKGGGPTIPASPDLAKPPGAQ